MRDRLVVGVVFSLALCGCTQPGETTKMGAAAGGVLGAGLGAVIGSQTGTAGAGLAIGAVAGAGTGAMVGNALESQSEAIKTQDLAIERQQQLLTENRRQLDLLRAQRRDSGVGGSASLDSSSRASFSSRRFANASSDGYAVRFATPSEIRAKLAQQGTMTNSGAFDSTGHAGRHSVVTDIREDYTTFEESRPAARMAKKPASVTTPSKKTKGKAERSKAISSKSSQAIPSKRTTKPAAPGKSAAVSPAAPAESKLVGESAFPTEQESLNGSELAREFDAIAHSDSPSPSDPVIASPEVANSAASEPSTDTFETGARAGSSTAAIDAVVAKVDRPAAIPATTDSIKQPVAPLHNTETAKSAVTAPVSAECSQAAAEAEKAQISVDVADKLFHLRRSLRLCPTEPQYHNAIGEVYLSLKRSVDAEYAFREALRVNPQYAPAKKNLEQIQ